MCDYCDNCKHLGFAYSRNIYSAHCCDPDKPVFGELRTLDVSRVQIPIHIPRPAWCQRKEDKHERREDQS